jgi:5-formyltetrahydrofolate cyclo-ligase
LLTKSTLFTSSLHIACYFSQGNEFNCASIIEAIWRAHKNCYLPVLSSSHDNSLEFVSYNKNDLLCLNRYNILEPQKAERFDPGQLDLVLLPLVGFDLHGHRLGMGGGYYDKTFSFLKGKKQQKPYLLGIAYELQRLDQLPEDPWDVSLDGVLTEKTLYTFSSVLSSPR